MSTLDDLTASALNAPVTGLQQSPVGTGSSGGFLNNLLTGIGNLPLSGLAQTGLSYAALDDVMDRLSSVGSGLATGAQRIGEEAAAGTAFRPFTVSTGFGGVTTTPEGGYATTLSPAMAAQQQALQGITSGLLGGMGGMGSRYAMEQAGPSPAQRFQGSSGPRPPSLEEVLSQRGFTMPERPRFSSQDVAFLGTDPVTGRMRQGGSTDSGYYKKLDEMYAQNPEALELAKQYTADPTQFGGERPTDRTASLGGLIGALQPEQPLQAPMVPMAPTAPATGGFGAGIPDVSGIQRQALGGVGGFLTGAMAPMAQREADVYERIRAVQRPGEERERLALQDQLLSQGRLGLRTAQFGGSPEQFALAQAQEEAKNRAALGALGQAQAEQLQQAGLAESMFGLGGRAAGLPASLQLGQLQNIGLAQAAQYLPEQQLLSSLTPAINIANIAGTGQRQGAGYLAEAGVSGLESQTQTELARANLLGQIYSSMLGAAGATGAAEAGAGSTNDLIGSIFGGETLGGLFSSIFN